ncbi:CheR family methyltransferase [Natronospira bacteriovora]|uniref:protein-glutamate O-methyltransferase n=1 Tax=Natronospira bacteriovora TaxID=3069753 RepID=A0ABU0W8V9_9GAMM|nr:protein-glutamate O-methyltransferase CheR [Natronospira sp. AB-CW4]MDQ2069420.1 protein-glutamate O-methyltransferase CheR [Natronospira sp. AB-CW4]
MNDVSMAMSDKDFEAFRALFLETLGLYFEDHRRYLVEKRVASRMKQLRLSDHRRYLAVLQSSTSTEEFEALTNAITVNETYFNREYYQLQCMTRSLLPEIVVNRRRRKVPDSEPLRIWSIPCSTGEEPYSVAMELLDAWPAVDDYIVEIHASDVDTDALRRAKEGVYGERALRMLPAARRECYLRPEGPGQYRICEAIRRSVSFSKINLNSDDWMARLPPMDVILCRNLLIYFNDESRREAAGRLFKALRPGGFVCLGHSESMHRMNADFLYRRFPEAIVYQRPVGTRGPGQDGSVSDMEDLACG